MTWMWMFSALKTKPILLVCILTLRTKNFWKSVQRVQINESQSLKVSSQVSLTDWSRGKEGTKTLTEIRTNWKRRQLIYFRLKSKHEERWGKNSWLLFTVLSVVVLGLFEHFVILYNLLSDFIFIYLLWQPLISIFLVQLCTTQILKLYCYIFCFSAKFQNIGSKLFSCFTTKIKV